MEKIKPYNAILNPNLYKYYTIYVYLLVILPSPTFIVKRQTNYIKTITTMMKKTIFLALIAMICSLGVVSARGLNTIKDKKFTDAVAQADADSKILIVDVYAEWCPPCKFMTANVFPSADIETLNAKFVLYKLDAEKGEGPELAKKWNIRGYPTFIFFKNGKEISRHVGGTKTAADFIEIANKTLSK